MRRRFASLSTMPKVKVTLCDDAYWQRANEGARPTAHMHRQMINVRRAYNRAREDWLFFCDADEFLIPDRPVAEILDHEADRRFLRVQVAERAFQAAAPLTDIFQGVFRRPTKDLALLADLYGPRVKEIDRGVLGHNFGKAFTRTGQKMIPDIHLPFPAGLPPRRRAALRQTEEYQRYQPDMTLLHFDGLTPTHWLVKILQKIRSLGLEEMLADLRVGHYSPRRSEQFRSVFHARGDWDRLVAAADILALSEGQAARLEAAGLLFRPDLALAAQARTVDPDLDFSVAGFDAMLARQHADLAAHAAVFARAWPAGFTR